MLEARAICFGPKGTERPILDRVDLVLRPGEITGLEGSSGVGKTTLGKILAGHVLPDQGQVTVMGEAYAGGFHPVQYLHQLPIFGVNPRWRIGRILTEAWALDEETRAQLGIARNWDDRFPHEISGGQLARVVLARALAPGLRFLVLDEITAALDSITQAQLWRFLTALARERGIGLLAISHDRALLERVASRRLRLQDGQLEELVAAR